MDKQIRVFLKGSAQEAYLELKKRTDKESKSMLRSFERIKEIIKENPQYGDPISKDKIPKKYLDLGINNLYRVELSNFWRALYTIEGDQINVLLFFLDIVDHSIYNKLFGYRKN